MVMLLMNIHPLSALKGKLTCISKTSEGVEIKRQLFPSTDKAVFIEKFEITNNTHQAVIIEIPKN